MTDILRRSLCIVSAAFFVSGALVAACADNGTNPIPVVPPFDGDGGPSKGDAGGDGASDAGRDGASDAGPEGASDASVDDASDAASLDGGTAEAGDSGTSTADGASDGGGGEDGSTTPTDGAATDV